VGSPRSVGLARRGSVAGGHGPPIPELQRKIQTQIGGGRA